MENLITYFGRFMHILQGFSSIYIFTILHFKERNTLFQSMGLHFAQRNHSLILFSLPIVSFN